MTVTVQDSAGNEASDKVTGVTLDNMPLDLTTVFPISSATDTVNMETVDVIININEAADSISVRWVELAAEDAVVDSKTKSVAGGNLATVDDDITVNFTGFGEDQDGLEYTLQTFARDVVGNITLTPPDTLTFDDDFKNPKLISSRSSARRTTTTRPCRTRRLWVRTCL